MNREPKLVLPYQRSKDYGPEYIKRIRAASPVPVEVVQEERWPGWWCKMGLFDPSVRGDFLVCDLDTIIVGDITPLTRLKRTMMLRDFFFPQRPASGVMFLTEADRAKVWERWIARPEHWMERFAGIAGGGDGAFLADTLKPRNFLQDQFPGWICSFKVDCRQSLPSTARMICYHGKPRPHMTKWAINNAQRWVKGVPQTALHCRGQGVMAR